VVVLEFAKVITFCDGISAACMVKLGAICWNSVSSLTYSQSSEMYGVALLGSIMA